MIFIRPDAYSLVAHYENIPLPLNDQIQLAKENLKGFQQAVLFYIPLLEQIHPLSSQQIKWKTVPCKMWTDQTTCPRGPWCHFSHNLAILWANNLASIAKNFPHLAQFKTLPCKLKGRCKRKRECWHLHKSGELCLLPLFHSNRELYGFRLALFERGDRDQKICRDLYKKWLRRDISPIPKSPESESSDEAPSPIAQLFNQKCLIAPLALSRVG